MVGGEEGGDIALSVYTQCAGPLSRLLKETYIEARCGSLIMEEQPKGDVTFFYPLDISLSPC